MKAYIARRIGGTKGPRHWRQWRLYFAPRKGRVLGSADQCGTFDSLRKIRDILAYGGRAVKVLPRTCGVDGEYVRDQVVFIVGPKGSAV